MMDKTRHRAPPAPGSTPAAANNTGEGNFGPGQNNFPNPDAQAYGRPPNNMNNHHHNHNFGGGNQPHPHHHHHHHPGNYNNGPPSYGGYNNAPPPMPPHMNPHHMMGGGGGYNNHNNNMGGGGGGGSPPYPHHGGGPGHHHPHHHHHHNNRPGHMGGGGGGGGYAQGPPPNFNGGPGGNPHGNGGAPGYPPPPNFNPNAVLPTVHVDPRLPVPQGTGGRQPPTTMGRGGGGSTPTKQPPNSNSNSSSNTPSPSSSAQLAAASKLRSGAVAFVPKKKSPSDTPNPEGGAVAASPGSEGSSSGGFATTAATRLSAEAKAYTPTRRTAPQQFPSNPNNSKPDGSATPSEGGGGGGSSVSQPLSPNVKSPAPISGDSPPPQSANEDDNDIPEQQEDCDANNDDDAAAAAADADGPSSMFARSKLRPTETKPVPAAPVKLNSSWTLFAISQPPSERAVPTGVSAEAQAALGKSSGGQQGSTYDPVKIRQIQDMEGFWRLVRGVPLPSTHTPAFTYYWFRKTINPSWEDPRNRNGGIITLTVWDPDRLGLQDRTVIDDAWMLMLLGFAGESVEEAHIVNGIAIKIRRTVTLQIWTSSSAKPGLQTLANSVRKLLEPVLTHGLDRLEFVSHASAKAVAAAQAAPKGGKGGAKTAPKPPTRDVEIL